MIKPFRNPNTISITITNSIGSITGSIGRSGYILVGLVGDCNREALTTAASPTALPAPKSLP